MSGFSETFRLEPEHLNLEVAVSSETSVSIYQSIRLHIPESVLYLLSC